MTDDEWVDAHAGADAARYDDDVLADFDEYDAPPFDESYLEEQAAFEQTPSTASVRRPSRDGSLAEEVFQTLRRLFAAANGMLAADVDSLIGQIRVSKRVLDELTDEDRLTFEGVLECADFEIAVLTPDAAFDLAASSHVTNQHERVQAFVDSLPSAEPIGEANPLGIWMALSNEVQARHTRRTASRLLGAIDDRAPVSEQLDIYDRLEAPATKVATVRETGLLTVDKMFAELEAQGVNLAPYRLSSGYPLLDATQTGDGEELGVIAPGEMMLVLGATGTGKSSFEYALQRASTLDLTLRYPDAKSFLLHTEEASTDKARAIGLGRGQPWHFLSKNVYVENIGSSRRRIAESIFEAVADAVRQSEKTGRNPLEFVVHKVHLDYIQAVMEPGEDPNTAVNTTAELILRGIQECNPMEIEKFSGVNFERYTGMRWPEELEHHRIAVVAYGQLRKATGDAVEYYDPKNRKHSLSTFSIEDTSDDPGWVSPDGDRWCWEVKGGDFRLFTKNDIYGSSKPLQNATSVLLLHRSRPQKNPKEWQDENGFWHLADERARLVLDKARNGQSALYVPMAFNVDPAGFRAQYYDVAAQQMVDQGHLDIEMDYYRQPGDPMIPKRARRSAFADLHYG